MTTGDTNQSGGNPTACLRVVHLSTANMSDLLDIVHITFNKKLISLEKLNFSNFIDYVGSDGSGRLIKEGYKLYIEEYLHDIWVGKKDEETFVIKAKCYPSMRKNERARELFFIIGNLPEFTIKSSFCSCKAGKGKCIHLAALFHQMNHWALTDLKEIPEDVTCTSEEQQWHKPRGKKIEAESIMNLTFAKPKMNRKRAPLECSFQKIDVNILPSNYERNLLREDILKCNNDYPLSYLITSVQETENLLNVDVPKNCTLAHQLKSLHRQESTTEIDDRHPGFLLSDMKIPIEVVYHTDFDITLEEAIKLELKTRLQNNVVWLNARKPRLTASTFGEICKRKKKITENFLKKLYDGQNLSKLRPILYGKKNEQTARTAYEEKMITMGKSVKVSLCGFVVNPSAPFLGCSPDGKISDDAELNLGLLEVKCPLSQKNKTFEEACSDKNFFYQLIDGKPQLKNNSNYYYQIQGQMHITSTNWCDFVTFNGQNVWITRIQKNESFCKEMIKKLCTFYQTHWHEYVQSRSI